MRSFKLGPEPMENRRGRYVTAKLLHPMLHIRLQHVGTHLSSLSFPSLVFLQVFENIPKVSLNTVQLPYALINIDSRLTGVFIVR